MALRAADAESEEKLTGDIREFCLDQFALAFCICLVPFVNSVAEVPGSDEDIGIFRSDFVSGELLADELVVWFVLIEGFDHVIPVRPCIRTIAVLAVAIGLRVAGKIQPVLAPALAIARGFEKLLDELFVFFRIFIRKVGIKLAGRRWQAVHIEIQSPDKLLGRRLRRLLETVLLQLCKDEFVHIVFYDT